MSDNHHITSLEHILTNSWKADMISYLAAHPEDFNEAVELAVSDRQPYAWRAAWLLWSCMEKNDARVHKYIPAIIDCITSKTDDHQRELIKILQPMDLTEEYESFMFDLCTSIWEKINKKPSIRFTAFRFMIKLAKNHPDLSNEITLLTQDHYLDSISPAARKSIFRMLKELE
jgi:hypothetical protein